MRKALLVVVLIGASFAGGAVVNGPGLRWAQACVLQRMGIGADRPTEVLSADTLNTSAAVDEGIPAQPIAPLVLNPPDGVDTPKELARADVSAPNSESIPAARTKKPLETPPAIEPLEVAEAPTLAPAPTPLPLPLAADSSSATPAVENDGPIRQASLPSKAADEGADSASSSAPPSSTPNAIPSDWASVRQAMKSLGVARYGSEGDPSGRVRFHCVIPLAGRRAVGQYFEAEGDDDLQAAQAALKRVALWRAAEADTPLPRTP